MILHILSVDFSAALLDLLYNNWQVNTYVNTYVTGLSPKISYLPFHPPFLFTLILSTVVTLNVMIMLMINFSIYVPPNCFLKSKIIGSTNYFTSILRFLITISNYTSSEMKAYIIFQKMSSFINTNFLKLHIHILMSSR